MTPQQILDFSYAYSRQGNIYAGDTQYSNGNLSPNGLVDSLYGHETNRLYRQSRDSPTTVYGIGVSPKPVFTTRKPTIPACRKALPAASKA